MNLTCCWFTIMFERKCLFYRSIQTLRVIFVSHTNTNTNIKGNVCMELYFRLIGSNITIVPLHMRIFFIPVKKRKKITPYWDRKGIVFWTVGPVQNYHTKKTRKGEHTSPIGFLRDRTRQKGTAEHGTRLHVPYTRARMWTIGQRLLKNVENVPYTRVDMDSTFRQKWHKV